MKSILTTLIAAIAILISSSFSPFSPDTKYVIIVNSENTTSDLTASKAKLIFLRKITKRWKELNKNIVPVDRIGEVPIRTAFLNKILKMSSTDLYRYFTEREHKNATAAPSRLRSDEEVVKYVEANIGAIGYVKKSSVKGNVKVVLNF
jgi:ABC-type phosphate transport system substrate-binding protein